MNNTRVFFAIAAFFCATSAYAGEAHVCESKPVAGNSANARLSDATVFSCGSDFSATIPELAKSGWKIVQITDQADVKNNLMTYAQMIIQRD